MPIERLSRLDLADIQTLIFAGGGNRCWWQAGVVTQWLEQGGRLPARLVGTSAGAAVAAACLTTGAHNALDACVRLFDANPRIFDWRGLRQLKLRFAHQQIYPAWLSAFLDAQTFEAIRNAPSRLQVAITRPARALGLGGSIMAGTLAYLIDKHVWNRLHPRLPRLLGLRHEFLELQKCTDVADARNLLVAAAAAPPFLSAQRIDGRHAIDGGYLDNAPIPPQTSAGKTATLILLTRHHPKLPTLFRSNGRHYWQPSGRIPVSTWDCTPRATVHAAFALGRQDARCLLDQRAFQLQVAPGLAG
ncbi:patatin-like phospholipase family protein [Rhodanobacter sp. Col0626]|uniref:patatin-like phospholipase family protein n=1 Tax=Rhodanobacter sp. Col0626 TaxID=3415679 RepID=UPI003CF51EFC